MPSPPILDNKDPEAASVFAPAALLRQARRQKGLPVAAVPRLCVLDPDGDIVRRLQNSSHAMRAADWPCYHTALHRFRLAGETAGIVGCAVGAPFAVLVAEQLFACGCRILISLTSAGQIVPAGRPPYFVVIDRALRDEGTSYHYAAPADFAEADPGMVAAADAGARRRGVARPCRPELDDRCAVSRNRHGRCGGARQGRACRRDGGRRALDVRAGGTKRCSVLPMSPTRWDWPTTISRRVKQTGRPPH